MHWAELREFNFSSRDNVFLFLERGRPLTTVLVLVALFALILWLCSLAIDPNWHPGRLRGKGVWVVALIMLLPIALRVVVLGLCTGLIAESAYRSVWRCFDGKPDFVIGPSGIADLNPWKPRVIWWYEIREIRRYVTQGTLFTKSGQPMCLQFVARRRRPSWLPDWLWQALSPSVVERRIDIGPASVGWNDRGLVRLVERYADNIAIVDVPYSTR